MNKQPLLSLVVIHRRAGYALRTMLFSVKGQFDEIVLVDTGHADQDEASLKAREVINDIRATWPREDCKIITAIYTCAKEWEDDEGNKFIGDFAVARNYAHSLASGEYHFSLDVDDILCENADFRKLIHEWGDTWDALFLPYVYSAGLQHTRARMWREAAGWEWQGAIHERREAHDPRVIEKQFPVIIHHGDAEASTKRNQVIVKRLIEEDQSKDPQALLAYAAILRGEGELLKAAQVAQRVFQAYPEDETGVRGAILAASACLENGRSFEAVSLLGEAGAHNPNSQELKIELAHYWEQEGDTQKTLLYYDQAYFTPRVKPSTQYFFPEEQVQHKNQAAMFYASQGDFELGLELAEGEIVPVIQELHARRKLINSFSEIVTYFRDHDEGERAELLVDYVAPKSITGTAGFKEICQDAREIGQHNFFFEQVVPPSLKPRIDVVAPGIVEWGPMEYHHKALGGSEQAVIHLMPLLDKYDVHVWGSIFREDINECEVSWHPLEEFDPSRRDRECVIVWRSPDMLDTLEDVPYPVIYWPHDVPSTSRKASYDKADLILPLSAFHMRFFLDMGIAGEKLLQFQNGVSLPALFGAWDIERNPLRVIYCSSAVRGLWALLDMWPLVLKEVPEASLCVTYPMELLDHPTTPKRIRDMKPALIKALKETPRVTWYEQGLPHFDYLRELARSSIWAYPTIFPEVSCIVAMEAQALGVWPHVTDSGALRETVLLDCQPSLVETRTREEQASGEILGPKPFVAQDYLQGLIYLLKYPPIEEDRANLGDGARRRYDWEVAATQLKVAIDSLKEKLQWQPQSRTLVLFRRKSAKSL